MKEQKVTEKQIKRFSPSLNKGLTEEAVKERISEGLTNSVDKKNSKTYLNIFTNNICTFFNLLGIIVCVALILAGAPFSDFFFVLIYLANILIGIVQEIRAKICIERLSIISEKTTKVLREGKILEINPKDIVLDDIICLGLGNQIPTDCKILEGEIEVNESLLTGESVPVKKIKGDYLLAGSFITSGICKVKADKVGKENYIETLSAKAKKYKKPQSEIMNSLKFLIKAIGIIIIPIATAIMIKSNLIIGENLSNSILKNSTTVLGMIPSGMFLLTSVALAVGIIKLAKYNTLVQDLYSLEMLARVDTLCFDKTGTITDGKMTVKEVIPLSDKFNRNQINEIMSSMIFQLKDNNQTAIALYNYFGEKSFFNAKTVIPFNSDRKLSAVTFEDLGTFSFGAPEFVLTKKAYSLLEPEILKYASLGLRVLLLARSSKKTNGNELPEDFSPIALISIVDNIRSDAIKTVKWFNDNGVNIKVISGDNPITVAEVSKRAGIKHAEKYISLEGLSEQDIYNIANEYTVFGRVSPEQKAILIKALKNSGHTVAMTGDGVNDILALKESDCAISVASGSDAARNVSHIVLMDNNFSSMPKVVCEGRRVINNVQSSSSLYLMKTLFTMILSIFTLIIPAFSTYPFTPSHMIILEVLIIGMPSFFLSLQPNDERVEGKFINTVLIKTIPASLLMILSVLIIELLKTIPAIHIFSNDVYTTMEVYVLNFAGLINLFIICYPFNLYRGIMFSLDSIIIILLTIFLFSNGMAIDGKTIMTPLPFSICWSHIIIMFCIILLDIPIAILLNKLCKKLKFKNVKTNKIKI